jgi:hypothetical protein
MLVNEKIGAFAGKLRVVFLKLYVLFPKMSLLFAQVAAFSEKSCFYIRK